MPRRLVLLRTHIFNDRILEGARAIAADGDYTVVVAIEERSAACDTGEFDKLVLTRRGFEGMGLLVDMDDLFWRCGDYPLYAARKSFPDAEFIWQYEYDTVINHASPAAMLREFDAASRHDLLATHLREPESFWMYKEAVEGRYPKTYRCYFPLVRLSARAIDFLLAARLRDSERLRPISAQQRPQWPNDEVLAATELINNGFACADFNDVRHCYTYETFWSDVLKHPSQLPAPDGMIYHAVRTGAPYAELLLTTPWITPRPKPAELWSFIGKDVDDELLGRALGDALGRYLATQGDDPERLSDQQSEVAILLWASQHARPVVDALIEALAAEHMFMTLNWLRRRGDALRRVSPLLDNLALGMPAWQSSISEWSRGPHPCIDAAGGNNGRRDVDYGFHTGWESAPFWAVDLMVTCRLHEVRLYNRHEHWHRLAGFRVRVSLDGLDWMLVHQNDPATEPVGPGTYPPLSVRTDAYARYVRVELPEPSSLHLREIEVYGHIL